MEVTNLWIFKNEFCQKVHKRYLHNVDIIILVWIETKFIVPKKWKVRSAMLVLQRNMFMYVYTCPYLWLVFGLIPLPRKLWTLHVRINWTITVDFHHLEIQRPQNHMQTIDWSAEASVSLTVSHTR